MTTFKVLYRQFNRRGTFKTYQEKLNADSIDQARELFLRVARELGRKIEIVAVKEA